MAEAIEQEGVVPATPEQIWDAWLDGPRHAEMTGSGATAESGTGGRFTAWGGYIRGTWGTLQRPGRIEMNWRTHAFPPDAPDSKVVVSLTPAASGGTLVHFAHTEIPDGQGADYLQGWIDHYLDPMRKHWG